MEANEIIICMSDATRHWYRNQIWKKTGKPIKGDKTYKERLDKATIEVWQNSGHNKNNRTIEQFRSVLYNRHTYKPKKEKKMQTVFTKPTLTEEEKHHYASEITKKAGGQRLPNYKERFHQSVNEVWKESTLKDEPEEYFRKSVLGHPGNTSNNNKKSKGEKEMNNNNNNNNECVVINKQKIIFKDLIRYVAKKCGYIPDDEIWKAIATGLGFVKENWMVSKSHLIDKEGWIFTAIPNAFKVEIKNPNADKIAELESRLAEITIELRQLKKQ